MKRLFTVLGKVRQIIIQELVSRYGLEFFQYSMRILRAQVVLVALVAFVGTATVATVALKWG